MGLLRRGWMRPVALLVTAAFAHRKKKGQREYVRVTLRRDADRRPLAYKHPVDGAGVLSLLTETDGLVELYEGRFGSRARRLRWFSELTRASLSVNSIGRWYKSQIA
jgi:molybdopterin biosynthesis enzyme